MKRSLADFLGPISLPSQFPFLEGPGCGSAFLPPGQGAQGPHNLACLVPFPSHPNPVPGWRDILTSVPVLLRPSPVQNRCPRSSKPALPGPCLPLSLPLKCPLSISISLDSCGGHLG